MRKRFLSIFLLFLMVSPLFGWETPHRIGAGFDPREPFRIVVLPTQISVKLKAVDPRTISALYETELVQKYDVLDLTRFEQYLRDNRLDLDKALSLKGRDVVLDSARVDAIADIEVYRWDPGVKRGLLSKSDKAKLGIRVRLVEPYSGQIIWSVNRVYKVTPEIHFLEAVTDIFVDLVKDLDRDLKKRSKDLDRKDRWVQRKEKKQQDRIKNEQDQVVQAHLNAIEAEKNAQNKAKRDQEKQITKENKEKEKAAKRAAKRREKEEQARLKAQREEEKKIQDQQNSEEKPKEE